MGFFSWIAGRAAGGVIEAVGTAVNKNIRTLKGDRAEVDAAIHDEQMAVLAEHASEFVSRPTRTKLDSAIDFLNRLPRVIITFWIFAIFTWPAIDSASFSIYILSMDAIPDELWQLAMVVLSLYFGGRIIASDIRKPRLSEEQKKEALQEISKREQAIIEAHTPLVVEFAPTRKPPPPPWTRHPELAQPPLPLPPIVADPVEIPITKGRPDAIDKMIADLIKREGGYSNNKNDSGKWTNYGITYLTLTAWRGNDCGEEEVKALTIEEAEEIYLAEYYLKPGIDSLPIALQEHVFDIGVNSGPHTAVKMLQKVLNKLGSEIKVDGLVGPMTREACNVYPFKEINNSLVGARIAFYHALAARRPKDQKFLNGWLTRARSFLV